jgi:hypothetical protein
MSMWHINIIGTEFEKMITENVKLKIIGGQNHVTNNYKKKFQTILHVKLF